MTTTFTTMGDPHLGRKFRTGVPLHRIGDREDSVWEDFEQSLMTVNTGLHICMGDLFDKFSVPPEVVLRAYRIYREAAEHHPDTTFFILRGNHDVSRDTTRGSSFDLFTELVRNISNVHIIDQVTHFQDYGFVPFDAFSSAEDQVRELPDDLDAVFMHHDFVDFGGSHVIPTKLLASKGNTVVVNGHDHLARSEKRHGVDVHMTGSLQPYTHAEDDNQHWYVTISLDELSEYDVTNKNVRVILQEGEDLPADLDCLSLIAKRELSGAEDVLDQDTTDFDTFDIKTALSEALHPSVREELMEKFDAV